MTNEITEKEISDYLDTRDDFDLELFAYRTLRENGWDAHLGGSYTDEITGKPRQYDVQALKEFHLHTIVMMDVECKSLSSDFPLVISRMPRVEPEAFHEIIRSWHRKQIGDTVFTIERADGPHLKLYPASEYVGKSTKQIKYDGSRKLIASDSDTYDKWSQALSASSSLIRTATKSFPGHDRYRHTFIMPILLVSDSTLWVVDYAEDGKRSAPKKVDETTLLVDRRYSCGDKNAKEYRINHLHVYTRTGFVNLLKNLGSPNGLMRDKIFGAALRSMPANVG